MFTGRASSRILGRLSRLLSRIFTIIRTRNTYGYNSVLERIFRGILIDEGSTRDPGGFKRRVEKEHV